MLLPSPSRLLDLGALYGSLPCGGGATPGLTLIRGIIAHSTVSYEPAEMETLIRTRLSRPLVNMILYIPPSLPSSARPLVVFGAIVASNPNPAFVFILAALAPRSQSRSGISQATLEPMFTRSFREPSSSHSQRRRRPRCPPTRNG